MLYNCTHMAIVGVKGLTAVRHAVKFSSPKTAPKIDCTSRLLMYMDVCCVNDAESSKEDWMNTESADDGGGGDDVDLSSLDVKPEYHTGRPTYTCPHCWKQFLYASQMRQHVRFHLKYRPYRCPICSKTFVQSSNLTEHFRIHTDERPFHCELCDRSFRQSSNLNYHVRTAHGNTDAPSTDATLPQSTSTEKPTSTASQSEPKTFSCEHCPRTFAHACQLTNHVRAHTKDKPYECRYCRKTFSYSSNLSEHIRVHTGERPYICATCGRSFAQSSQLKVHVKAHHPNTDGGATPLVICPVCSQRFTGLRALKCHVKQQHGDDSQQKKSVTRHRKTVMSSKCVTRSRTSVTRRVCVDVGDWQAYVCCYCEKTFMKQNHLVSHLWSHEPVQSSSHTSSCPVNDRAQIKNDTGSDSSGTEVEDAFQASDATSRLEDSSSKHAGRRQLGCPFCSKQFTQRWKWKTHIKTHRLRAQRTDSSKKKRSGSVGGSSEGRESQTRSPRTRSRSRGTVDSGEQLSTVKVENGRSVTCDWNDDLETSHNASSDGDDNTEEFDTVNEFAVKLLTDATTGGKRKHTKKKSKSSSAAAATTTAMSRTYPCDQCDRVMASAAALHYHRRTHSGVKPFACSHCPRRFLIRGQLVEHERIHTGEKPFACEHCPKRFVQSSQLRQHASIHSDVGTHICPTCGEAFTRPWRLLSHRRAAHDEDVGSRKRYRCEECGREYSLRQSWIYHRLTHSDDRPFQCPVCSRQFRVAGQLRQHANHCRGRRADGPPTDPLSQPSQQWLWYSPADNFLTPPVDVMAVPPDTSMSDSLVSQQEPATAKFHQL